MRAWMFLLLAFESHAWTRVHHSETYNPLCGLPCPTTHIDWWKWCWKCAQTSFRHSQVEHLWLKLWKSAWWSWRWIKTRSEKRNKGTSCAIGLVFRQSAQAGSEEEHLWSSCMFASYSWSISHVLNEYVFVWMLDGFKSCIKKKYSKLHLKILLFSI